MFSLGNEIYLSKDINHKQAVLKKTTTKTAHTIKLQMDAQNNPSS